MPFRTFLVRGGVTLPNSNNMQNSFVAGRPARPALMRGQRRTPSLLSAGLLVSVGLSLSTLSSSGWAQVAASDTAATLPAVSVSATKDTTVAQADTVSAGALGSRKQVDTPFSTHVVTSDEAQDLMAATANDLFKYDPAVVGHQRKRDQRKLHVHRARHADRHAEQHQGGWPDLPLVGHRSLARTVRAGRIAQGSVRLHVRLRFAGRHRQLRAEAPDRRPVPQHLDRLQVGRRVQRGGRSGRPLRQRQPFRLSPEPRQRRRQHR